MNESGFWRSQKGAARSIFGIIDDSIGRMITHNPSSLPDLRVASTILITSDYSGEHRSARHQVLSFLLADIERCRKWDEARLELRAKFFADKRRMSFKRLGDRQRQRALKPFLEAADNIPGLAFTVAIDSSIDSLFASPVPLDLDNPDFAVFRAWKRKTLEKAFRAIHFIALLLAGLSSPGQNVLWFTDEDAIAANPDRLGQLTNLFAWITSSYLTFNLGHLRCGTTQCDDGSMRIEDLAAVPDLVAGAVSEQLQLVHNVGPDMSSSVFWLHRSDFSPKTSFITWWLADTTNPLKRVFCLVDSMPDSTELNVSWFHFHDQS
jgi:hypothetical protein